MKSFGWYEDEESIFITMEHCHADLHHYVSRERSLSVVEAQQLTFQILEGLHVMHECGFAHRDLKPNVCMISTFAERYPTDEDLLLEYPH